jgi:hypothetical protein
MVSALLVGIGVLLGSMLFYGTTTAFLVQLVVRLIRTGCTGPLVWKNVAVMTVVSVVTAAEHLIVIALWAVVILVIGEMATFEKAFYVSAENYTALGYGDIVLSERWRLLGPLEAINGLLLFGVSTAVMFAVLNRLIASRLHVTLGNLDETASSQEHGPEELLPGNQVHAG